MYSFVPLLLAIAGGVAAQSSDTTTITSTMVPSTTSISTITSGETSATTSLTSTDASNTTPVSTVTSGETSATSLSTTVSSTTEVSSATSGATSGATSTATSPSSGTTAITSSAVSTATSGATTTISSTASATSDQALPTVTLDYSTVVPVYDNSSLGFYKFQNIRYAAPPIGSLRWAPPEWPETETEINYGNITTYDVACLFEEDCLFMDIYVPLDFQSKGETLPVAVFNHPGGFKRGSKIESTPEGLFQVSTAFIWVAYNYRVGATGVMSGPTFVHGGGTPNTCILDLEQAYNWVRKYIGNFGGNPNKVTAYAFCAGGGAVLLSTTRYGGLAEQLFDRAYIMSPGWFPQAGHYAAETVWQNMTTGTGCDEADYTCMLDAPFTNINSSMTAIRATGYYSQPRVDGYLIPDTTDALFYADRYNFSGPLVLSHADHESDSYATAGVNDEDDVRALLKFYYPAIMEAGIDQLLAYYPATDFTNSSAGLQYAHIDQMIQISSHVRFINEARGCDTWNARVSIWPAVHGTDQLYYFYSTNPVTSIATGDEVEDVYRSGDAHAEAVDTTTARVFQKYLLSFIINGDPNKYWSATAGKTAWPQYNTEDYGVTMDFNDTNILVADDLNTDAVDYIGKALWY